MSDHRPSARRSGAHDAGPPPQARGPERADQHRNVLGRKLEVRR
ncbi:MAG: hypothetical protein ACRC20_14115 [Segniliparus sp.]